MPERWVVNASPLILLAKVGHLHLVSELADDLVVPKAVLSEIIDGPSNDPARIYFESPSLPIVVVVPDSMVLAWDLGSGESAVLSYAIAHAGYKAVIDDGAARRCARALAISSLGTLGVVLRARQAGLIASAASLLRMLKDSGIRLDADVIRVALKTVVGDDWQ